MKVEFENLNNDDTDHEIIFLNLTRFSSGAEKITVLFDGIMYITIGTGIAVLDTAEKPMVFERCYEW